MAAGVSAASAAPLTAVPFVGCLAAGMDGPEAAPVLPDRMPAIPPALAG